MSNRIYRLLFGALLLIILYFDLHWGMYSLMIMLFLEGLTNQLVPNVVNRLFNLNVPLTQQEQLVPEKSVSNIGFSAERAWRLVVGAFLLVSFVIFDQSLHIIPDPILNDFSFIHWFFPWFMGFAILGAGLSGVCPVLFVVRWFGCK